MTELVEFLRARVDEDERDTRGRMRTTCDYFGAACPECGREVTGVSYSGEYDSALATHEWFSDCPLTEEQWTELTGSVSDPDPRVLAECEAKRRIIGRYEDAVARSDDSDYPTDDAVLQMREYEDFVLPALALPYADHPDYREEWRT